MTFPVTVKHRKAEVKIYGKQPKYPFYRMAYYVVGKRKMASFGNYSEAKAAAEAMAKDLAKGNVLSALNPKQARDALNALERLAELPPERRVSLLTAVSEYVESIKKLGPHTMRAAIEKFLAGAAVVKPKDLAEAVQAFLKSREHKTEAKDGKRAQLSKGYHYIVQKWLEHFAEAFPGHLVSDLTKGHLDVYMSKFGNVTARTRNGRRTVVGMFLKWCVRQDFLEAGHRLLEADGMAQEVSDADSIEFYTPEELAKLLKGASMKPEPQSGQPDYTPLLPVIALCSLAGLRLQEAVRLTWEDVFRVDGHIEISRTKSKTRARRLVSACASLLAWLAPYRNRKGLLWRQGLDRFHNDFGNLREAQVVPARRNGLRHGFCSYHFALHSNENLTAAEAGNTPGMIHAHYKGITTKKEAEKWFAVAPDPIPNLIQLASGDER